ncbi:hypothetical protein M3Y97_00241700 [Aphelenchoides bicaudatus]|nr:hypothetical protein M3Y97_00241700 [Aphelenchoides bicaudatus]
MYALTMPKKKQKSKKTEDVAETVKDPRLSTVQSDQTFREMPKREKKVKVDPRFKAMFDDERFASTSAKVDRHGRPINKLKDREDLRNLYELDESEHSDNEVEKPVAKNKEKRPDFARGEGNALSSSEEEESEAESIDDEQMEDPELYDIHKKWGELDNGVRRVEWTSTRLAVCNLDWDKMTADDIFVALESFKPDSGKIKSVHVYLSDFGAEQLKHEETHGPKLPTVKSVPVKEDDDSDSNNEDEADPEAVHAYQIERYRFYYAIVECDTDETANSIYEACDGVQYQNSGLKLDLRFVPDETTFETSRLRDQCSPENLNLRKYKPNNFMSAVTNSSAKLDWDAGDFQRKKKIQQAFSENAELDDLNDLIGSGSEDEMDTNAKDLLLAAASSANVYSKKARDYESDEDAEEKPVEPKKPAKSKNKFKAKLVEKKKRKLAESASHLPVNLDDSRFAALYTSSDFVIDKTDPHYRGGALADRQVEEKIRRIN